MVSRLLPLLLLAGLACTAVTAMPLDPQDTAHVAASLAPLPFGRTLLQRGGRHGKHAPKRGRKHGKNTPKRGGKRGKKATPVAAPDEGDDHRPSPAIVADVNTVSKKVKALEAQVSEVRSKLLVILESLGGLAERVNKSRVPPSVQRSLRGQLRAAEATSKALLSTINKEACPVEADDPPMITCPMPLTVEVGTNQGIIATATDAEDQNSAVVVVCDPATTADLVVGDTTATCTATDSAGNTDTCVVDIMVTSPASVPSTTCAVSGTGTFGTVSTPDQISGCTVSERLGSTSAEDCADVCAAAGSTGCVAFAGGTACLQIVEVDNSTSACATGLASAEGPCAGSTTFACARGTATNPTIEDIDCATSDGPIPPICENSADGEDPLRGADVTAESCRTSCAEAALAAGADRACEFNLGFNPQLGEFDPAGNSCILNDPSLASSPLTLDDCDAECGFVEILCS